MIFDPLYFLIIAPGLLLAAWASFRVHSAFAEGQRYSPASGLCGAEAAAEVMRAGGVTGVGIEPVPGELTDHYDPHAKVLRLSEPVYAGRSLSALGVAAHEAGHAIQDATHYPLLFMRNGLVPLATIGSSLSYIFFLIGIVLLALQPVFGQYVILAGIALFSLTVIFQLVNLPVEFDASRRARVMLVNHGLITEEEDLVVKKVLSAAALTYVAATLTAILTLLYYLIRSGVLGGRDD
jgi:Zn-dependent membrane protease YugP